MSAPGQTSVRWMPVDAQAFESVGYSIGTRQLYIKFRGSPAMCFDGVPGFRYQGLLSAARKDAYFRTYIQRQFLSKELPAS